MTSRMRKPTKVVLARGRVTLEPWRSEHDSDLFTAAQDDDIWRWLPAHRPYGVQEMAVMRQTHTGLPWAVVVDGIAAGSTSYLNADLSVGGLEIGWTWYRRDLWATDVNSTCKMLHMEHAFEKPGRPAHHPAHRLPQRSLAGRDTQAGL